MGTISKLRKEMDALKVELAEKNKQEAVLKEHVRRLEENERMFTLQTNVKTRIMHRNTKLEARTR